MQLKDLNLIPKNYFVTKKEKAKKAYLSVLIFIVVAAFAAIYIAPTVYESNLRSEKISLEKKIEETNGYVVYQKDFNILKQAVEAREQEAVLLSKKQLNITGIVAAIEKASPEKLFIQKFDTAGEDESDVKVTLKGVAENEETIASFISNLKDEAYFKEYGLSTIANKNGNNGSSFSIVLTGVNKESLTKYNGFDNEFSIGYIPGWSISEEKDNKVVFTAKSSLLISAKPASVEILSEPTKLKVDAYEKERQSKLKKDLNNFKLIYSSNIRNSKMDAVKTVYSMQQDSIEYQLSELCVVKNNKCYIVTYKSDSTDFKNTEQIVDRILKSFSIN